MDEDRGNKMQQHDLLKGAQTFSVKWVYKKKMNVQGEIEWYKVRLVAKSYKYKEGVDYGKVFTPVTRMEIVWMLILSVA